MLWSHTCCWVWGAFTAGVEAAWLPTRHRGFLQPRCWSLQQPSRPTAQPSSCEQRWGRCWIRLGRAGPPGAATQPEAAPTPGLSLGASATGVARPWLGVQVLLRPWHMVKQSRSAAVISPARCLDWTQERPSKQQMAKVTGQHCSRRAFLRA